MRAPLLPKTFSAACLLLLAALTSCGEREPQPSGVLAGRWEHGTDRVEFLGDGRVLLARAFAKAVGHYGFVEADRVVLSFPESFLFADAGDYRVRIVGDTARLCETYRPDRCVRLVRAAGDWIEGPPRWVDSIPPRLAEAPRLGAPIDRRVMVASMALAYAHGLQAAFRGEEGRYAQTMAELERAGWQPGLMVGYDPLEVVRADDRVCIVARPRTPELPHLYVNADGRVGFGASCP